MAENSFTQFNLSTVRGETYLDPRENVLKGAINFCLQFKRSVRNEQGYLNGGQLKKIREIKRAQHIINDKALR